MSELYRVIGDCATTHFIFAKHILPAMRQEAGSSFLFITGGAGEWRQRVQPPSRPVQRLKGSPPPGAP